MKTDNELIAEFMGVPKLPDKNGFVWDVSGTGKGIYSLHSKYLRYHEKWDWLMPVVEKIESLEVKFKIDGVRVLVVSKQLQYYWNGGMVSEPKIICVYHGCVQFIKWYNEQTLKQNQSS